MAIFHEEALFKDQCQEGTKQNDDDNDDDDDDDNDDDDDGNAVDVCFKVNSS